jgi:CheY-like chemotaxis protein
MRVLVVDDEVDIVLLFKQKFKKEINQNLIEFQFVHSAEEALGYLKGLHKSELVLILSDINMPGMNGLELLKVLKEDSPHLTVFMITAYDDETKHQKAIEYGADKYLTKPIDFDVLKKAMFDFQSDNNIITTEQQ